MFIVGFSTLTLTTSFIVGAEGLALTDADTEAD